MTPAPGLLAIHSMKAPFLLGRLIVGGFFIYNGVNHLKQRQALSQYAAAKKIPLADIAVPASGVALLVGGASILLGAKPKVGAATLAAFLATVSPLMHRFWEESDPQQRQNEMVHFTKNLALLGSALVWMGMDEPWPVSVPMQRTSGARRLLHKIRCLAA